MQNNTGSVHNFQEQTIQEQVMLGHGYETQMVSDVINTICVLQWKLNLSERIFPLEYLNCPCKVFCSLHRCLQTTNLTKNAKTRSSSIQGFSFHFTSSCLFATQIWLAQQSKYVGSGLCHAGLNAATVWSVASFCPVTSLILGGNGLVSVPSPKRTVLTAYTKCQYSFDEALFSFILNTRDRNFSSELELSLKPAFLQFSAASSQRSFSHSVMSSHFFPPHKNQKDKDRETFQLLKYQKN